jgi:hypothetical protein
LAAPPYATSIVEVGGVEDASTVSEPLSLVSQTTLENITAYENGKELVNAVIPD